MKRLSLTDKIKAMNSGLFIVIGVIIVIRTVDLMTDLYALFPLLVGISFIGFGIYRIRFVVKYIRSRQ
ncbi:MAG: hypothetical protein ACP5JP_08015 [bacterium]